MNENNYLKDTGTREDTKELSLIIRYLYESFEMLSRWTPDFTAKEFLVVLSLRKKNYAKVSEIAKETGFSMSTVSWLINSLSGKKIVERRRQSSDRRVVMIKLTPGGQEALAEYDHIFDDIAGMIFSSLEPGEKEEYMRLSRKIFKISDKEHKNREGTEKIVNPEKLLKI